MGGRRGNLKKQIHYLVIVFLHRFCQENFFLDKYVRYNLTVYPVVIIALTGSMCKDFSISSPTTNGVFIGESLIIFGAVCFSLQLKLLPVSLGVEIKLSVASCSLPSAINLPCNHTFVLSQRNSPAL